MGGHIPIGNRMLLWFDLETTGLNPTQDHILEVAWTLTHPDLSPLLPKDTIRSFPIWTDIRVFDARVNDYVREMHTKTGLTQRMQTPNVALQRMVVERYINEDLDKALDVVDEPIYLAGASVHFDKAFLDYWMPALAKRLSHRVYDTSTLKAFFEALGYEHGVINEQQHAATDDVREVLSVARAYRDRMSLINNAAELLGMKDPQEYTTVETALGRAFR